MVLFVLSGVMAVLSLMMYMKASLISLMADIIQIVIKERIFDEEVYYIVSGSINALGLFS